MSATSDAMLLATVEGAAVDVLTLVEGLTERELASARLTRRHVRARLTDAFCAMVEVGADTRQRMPEVDWSSWLRMGSELQAHGEASFDAMWCIASELAGPTLAWFRLYKVQSPELFRALPVAQDARVA